jgi:hypothetical protein
MVRVQSSCRFRPFRFPQPAFVCPLLPGTKALPEAPLQGLSVGSRPTQDQRSPLQPLQQHPASPFLTLPPPSALDKAAPSSAVLSPGTQCTPAQSLWTPSAVSLPRQHSSSTPKHLSGTFSVGQAGKLALPSIRTMPPAQRTRTPSTTSGHKEVLSLPGSATAPRQPLHSASSVVHSEREQREVLYRLLDQVDGSWV